MFPFSEVDVEVVRGLAASAERLDDVAAKLELAHSSRGRAMCLALHQISLTGLSLSSLSTFVRSPLPLLRSLNVHVTYYQ